MPTPSFQVWIVRQRRRDDEVGQFAREACNDGNLVEWTTRDLCINDLATQGAAQRFIDGARSAWNEYERSS